MSSVDRNDPGMLELNMSDIERSLRELSLAPVSAELDARVLGAIRASSGCDYHQVNGSAVVPSACGNSDSAASDSKANESIRSSRNSGVVSIGWLACAVSLIIGAIAGRLFLPTTLRSPALEIDAANVFTTEFPGESDLRTNSSGSEVSAWTLESALKMGSKIVESSRFSPSVGAVAWEQQTGEIFRVGTHQADRRFAMCRECHRVGG